MRAGRELFLGDLRRRWVEYLLGAVVIAVVTGAVILQRSVTASTDDRVHDLAHKLGKNMLVVPAATEPADVHLLRYGEAGMPADYPERIRRSGLGQHIRLVHARLNANVEVDGVPLILVGDQARDDGAPANMSRAIQVELGPEAARRLDARPGDQLLIQKTPVLVTGVREPPPDGLGMGVFTSLAAAQQILARPGEINAMRLGGCWCRLDVPTLAADVEKLLPGTRAVTVAGVLKAQKETVATVRRYSLALYAVGVLLVGGTIIALISAQVRRSLREIGLLLALGASTATVQGVLVVKAALVGAAGAMLGYLAGIQLTTRVGSRLLQVPLEAPPGLWLPALGLCVLVSVAAAAVPAQRAAQLDPSQVLRED
jgi:predicted lysophospholipase L1 biosynthesis ABC-type transport system permease subunit